MSHENERGQQVFTRGIEWPLLDRPRTFICKIRLHCPYNQKSASHKAGGTNNERQLNSEHGPHRRPEAKVDK
jgi:hypothetical protein